MGDEKCELIVFTDFFHYHASDASALITRALDQAAILKEYGLQTLAVEFEASYIDHISSVDGILKVPIVMEMKNVTRNVSLWFYSDQQGFIAEGIDVQGLTRATCGKAFEQAQAIIKRLA